ncbi:class IV adenylate cyclase [Bryocella elongata]|uniref:class IV adenylate cyclase n=1 Tax=Bryocella elongata TaxID=863522 RepID=UPI002E0E90F8
MKFAVEDPVPFRYSALRAGFQLVTERSLETNTLYDTSDRQLRAKKQILRLREYNGHHVLTHKRTAAPSELDARFKTRVETETMLEDSEAMAEVFLQLGYGPVFRYEKFRTEFSSGAGHLVLDETPIGVWAELEGAPEWIDAMLERLQVGREQCSTDSYGKLFERWKTETGSDALNLTFEEVQAEVLVP